MTWMSEEAIIASYRKPTTPPPPTPREHTIDADLMAVLDGITAVMLAAGQPMPVSVMDTTDMEGTEAA